MKKIIIILSAILILFFGVIIVLPVIVKTKIKTMAEAKANASLNASFSYSNFDLTNIKSFPSVTATFLNVAFTDKKSSEKDTLITISELSVSIFLPSVFKKSGILFEEIHLDKLNLQGGKNTVEMTASFKSILTEPYIEAKLNGIVDLEVLTKFFPVENVTMKGLIMSDATFSVKMSDIKSNNFDSFVSTGNFKLCDVIFQDSSLSMSVGISEGTVDLKNQDIRIAVKQLLYNQINVTDLNGRLELKNHQLTMSDFVVNMLGGTLKMDGTLIADGKKNAVADFDIDAKGFDITSAFSGYSFAQKYLPFAEKTEGKLSTAFNIQSRIGEKLNMDPASLKVIGSFSTYNVKMVDVQSLNSLKSVIQPLKLKNLELDNFTAYFVIKDSNLIMKPFKTALGDQPISISGAYNFAGKLDYRIDATLDRVILSDNIQNIISYMPGHKSITKVDVGIDVTGDIKKPDVEIDTEKIKKQVVDQFKNSSSKEIKDAAKKLFEKFLR